MEPDADFLRAWARSDLSDGLQVARALLETFETLSAVVDMPLPLYVYDDRPALSRAAYEQNIVEWRDYEGRTVPYFDLERSTRERLLHFLSRPGRALLFEDAHTFPVRWDWREAVDPPLRVFYRRVDAPEEEEEETYALLPGPVDDERQVQHAITLSPTYKPWRHVGALLDGVPDEELPATGSIVDGVAHLVRHAVGMILGLGDHGYVFFWGEGCEELAVPDRVRTRPHATENGSWWKEESPEG